MEVVPTVGKLLRVSPQIDCPLVSVRSSNPKDDTAKHVLSESRTLEDASIQDETSKDTAVVYPSPLRKCVRFADGIPGRSLFDMCPADPHVGNTQAKFSLPVSSESVSKDVGNKQADYSLPVFGKFVSPDVNEDCLGHERSSIHNNNS